MARGVRDFRGASSISTYDRTNEPGAYVGSGIGKGRLGKLPRRERTNPFASGRLYLSMEAKMTTVPVIEKTFEATVEQGIVRLA